MDLPDNLRSPRCERPAAQTAGHLGGVRRYQSAFRDRRVRGDHSSRIMAAANVHRCLDPCIIEVGSDLHEQRLRSELAIPILQGAEQFVEAIGPLQVTEIRRVRGRNVDRDVIRNWMDQIESRKVVLDGLFVRHILILANVHANNAFAVEFRQSIGDRFGTVVVESQPIDQCLILREPQQPRPFVSRLRFQRYRPDFDKSEPQRGKLIHDPPILIETGGNADRIPELQTEPLDLVWKLKPVSVIGHPLRRLTTEGVPQKAYTRLVGLFGIKAEEYRPHTFFKHFRHLKAA